MAAIGRLGSAFATGVVGVIVQGFLCSTRPFTVGTPYHVVSLILMVLRSK